jgi:hypothetical protein
MLLLLVDIMIRVYNSMPVYHSVPYNVRLCTCPVAVKSFRIDIDRWWTIGLYPSYDRQLYSHTRQTVRCAALVITLKKYCVWKTNKYEKKISLFKKKKSFSRIRTRRLSDLRDNLCQPPVYQLHQHERVFRPKPEYAGLMMFGHPIRLVPQI